MIHPELSRTITDMGFEEMKEIFSFEKKEGNWSYLRLRQPEFNCEKSAEITLIWEMVAVSAEGPVSQLEQVSLSILLTPNLEKGVTSEIRKTWKADELRSLVGNRPARSVMLEYLVNYGPLSFPGIDTLVRISSAIS